MFVDHLRICSQKGNENVEWGAAALTSYGQTI